MNLFKLAICSFFCFFTILLSPAQITDSIPVEPEIPLPSEPVPLTPELPTPLTPLLSHVSHSLPFTSVHYRGAATVAINEQSQTCQFTIVNVIDSFLYVQLHVGAIEIGRALATPDNILFINKLQRNYYQGDYFIFDKILYTTLDFYTLQGILNGSLIAPPEELELAYQRDSVSYEYPFFNTLFCEYFAHSLKLDLKKVTFNSPPNVSVSIPKNYTVIDF
ncbi:MAG: DUF4292 domain-containing protein [Lentimicrobiaceae bacterium]|nr:DUF4292 domain-containing protein [Lentimicrobiaceae bacterium]